MKKKKKHIQQEQSFPWTNLIFSLVTALVIVWAVTSTVKSNPPDDYLNENLLGEPISSSGTNYGITTQGQSSTSTSDAKSNNQTTNIVKDNQIIIQSNNNLNKPADLQGGQATTPTNTGAQIQGNNTNLQDAYQVKPGELDNLNL